MPDYTQDNLLFTVLTPLGKDRLLFKSLRGEEKISGLFHFEVEMLSQYRTLSFDDIVGKNFTVKVEYAPDNVRYFNGVVTRFMQAGMDVRMTVYRAEIRPWLWQLTLTKNCRIFQQKSVPEIIKQVFNELGFTDYRDALIQPIGYKTREYCVQYEETAFDFVSRLMEDEGIFYFFEHSEDKHTLVLCDFLGVHKPCPGIDTVRDWEVPTDHPPEDVVLNLEFLQQMTTGKYAIDDFNFEIPTHDLTTSVNAKIGSELRIYEYGAGIEYHEQRSQKKVDRRIETHIAEYQLLRGDGHCFSFTSGYQFNLTRHRRREFNTEYVLREVSHSLSLSHYSNSFVAFRSDVRFHAPIVTPKPKIVSSQTAIVTGPKGEEIYTDKYGRIKVQFHWDQEGKFDENSSCWIRVNQGWAGKQWGSMFIPRIGQEVIVNFINGDPDRPLVTGSVYNGQQHVPYPLPDNQTISTIKSNSSKGGQGFNEIRFEDKKGKEQIFVHAERNEDIRVEKDAFEWIGEDRNLIVNANQYEEVKQDKNLQVKGDQFEAISHDSNLKVGDNYHISVGKSHDLQVNADLSAKVGSNKSVSVGANFNLNVGATISSKSTKVQQKVDKEYVLCVKEVIDIGSGKTFKLSAKDKLTLEVGGNFITIDSSGVAIKGAQVLINSGGCPGESSKCEPKKPKPACPPDPCTDPCQAGNANSGWKSIVKNALNSLDIEAGIGLDGNYKLGVSGGVGPLKGSGGISGNLRSGDFKYEAGASVETKAFNGNAKISGDDDGNFQYSGTAAGTAGPVKLGGEFKGDDDGNFQYGGTAAGAIGPVKLDGGFKGDSEGNFNAWLNAAVNVGDLLNKASKEGTPLVEACE